MRTSAVLIAFCYLAAHVAAQSAGPAQSPTPPPSPVFDVVSIKPSPPLVPGSFPSAINFSNQRPDGGFTMSQIPAAFLIQRAYPLPGASVADMVGLPEWATRDRFDISATSTLTLATDDDRLAMMRAMLADRFKLAVHIEQRPRQVFELMLARADGRLGKGLTPIEADCAAHVEATRAAAEAARREGRTPNLPWPDPSKPPAPCTLRSLTGRPVFKDGADPVIPLTRLEGEAAVPYLATFMRIAVDRDVVDKTGLAGSYRIAMDFDMLASRRGPEVSPSADAGPTVFAAVQEQLGLKLRPATVTRDTLIIDRLERPSEN